MTLKKNICPNVQKYSKCSIWRGDGRAKSVLQTSSWETLKD